jgi:lipid-A-disaccharide synthase
VPIDFPDFNLVLARAMKRLGVPIVYYISPQLWAWRRGRVRTIRRLVDRMLVIFPFEAPFYEQAGVPVSFVGHPLVELTPAVSGEGFLQRHALDPACPVVALLPGSRRNEVRAILPDLVRTAGVIAARVPSAQFVVARAPHLSDDLFAALDAWPVGAAKPLVLEGRTDEVLAGADVAIVASGTATVQAALHACPMVVVYRLAPSTYRLGKRFVHVDTFAMVNLIAGRRVVPELIQDAFTPERAAAEALRVLTDDSVRVQMRADLADVRARLGGRGASRRAAEEIIRIAALKGPRHDAS